MEALKGQETIAGISHTGLRSTRHNHQKWKRELVAGAGNIFGADPNKKIKDEKGLINQLYQRLAAQGREGFFRERVGAVEVAKGVLRLTAAARRSPWWRQCKYLISAAPGYIPPGSSF